MKLIAKNKIDIDALRTDLTSKFTEYKVKSPSLNKNMVRVISGLSWVSIHQKNDVLKVVGGINIMNMWVFIPFVIGLAFGLIGGGLILGLFWFITKKKSAQLEEEVGEYIKTAYQLGELNLAKA